MKDELRDKQLTQLYEAFASLQTAEDYKRFLFDLCTRAELSSMAQRLDVAIKLDKGAVYTEIVEETGASSATICRVRQYLNGEAEGYRRVLSKIKK